ncbi:MAG: hypothetical protein HXS48_27110 [Theionarchaea archaeon]|nr:hypothetical protein [Theionarchaea archaeon]
MKEKKKEQKKKSSLARHWNIPLIVCGAAIAPIRLWSSLDTLHNHVYYSIRIVHCRIEVERETKRHLII